MAEIHNHPQRTGGERPEARPERPWHVRRARGEAFVWYVQADIRSSRWRERDGQASGEEDESEGTSH